MAQPPLLTIGRYALYAEIASGGMASVHFARLLGHAGFSRVVAAKRLLPHMVKNAAFTAMLVDEAKLAARIHHPNVVSTLDVVSEDGELVLVMEYVHGEALSRLAQVASDLGEPISLQIATSVIIDTLHGLHAAHEATDESGKLLGVVHRDVSPQNVLVGVDGVARIADFGIAKGAGRSYETRDGTIKGKLSYMAPEQIERGELTRSTDIFATSIVLWELVTGRQLFEGATDAEVMHRVLTCEIPRASSLVPALPPEYDRVLERGLARDPAQRFGSAREMALELQAISTPMRASDIGAWVERIATDTLQRRSHLISKMERSSREEGVAFAATKPVTPTPMSGPTPTSTPPRASTPEPISNGATHAPSNTAVNVSVAAGASRRSTSWLPLVALASLCLGAAVAVLWLPHDRRAAPTATSGTKPSATAVSVAASAQAVPSSTSSSSGAPPASSGSTAPPSPSAASVPRVANDAGSKKAVAGPPGKKASVSCNPPYVIDPTGRRIFKLECM